MKKLLPILLSFLFLLLSSTQVSAQVVINEINASGEWVELFKLGSEAVILDGCTIFFHNNDSQKKPLTVADNFLETESYGVIATDSTQGYLNNTSSDTVFLDCPDFDAGPVVYPDNLGTKSYARVPNGTGDFVVTSEISQGFENPSPTLTPASTPSPTAEPTSAPTTAPTTAPTVAPIKTPTPIPTKSSTPKPTKSPTSEPEVLGEEATSQPETSSPAPLAAESTKKKFPFLPVIFIGSGVLMIGFAVYNLVRAGKSTVQN